jgi:hypothetical protein
MAIKRMVTQYVGRCGLLRETSIITKAPEEVITTLMTTAGWRFGIVLILKAYYMPGACGKRGKQPKIC